MVGLSGFFDDEGVVIPDEWSVVGDEQSCQCNKSTDEYEVKEALEVLWVHVDEVG